MTNPRLKSLARFLRLLSQGKYNPKLYRKGKAFEASIAGGIFTVVFGLGLIVYSIIVFINIKNRTNFTLNETAKEMTAHQAFNVDDDELRFNLTR